MPRIKRGDVKLRANIEGTGARHGFQQLQHGVDIVRHIERFVVFVVAVLTWLNVPRVFFLKMRGILEQNRSEIDSRRIGKDRASIPVLYEYRQPTGMVQVRMRQHQVVDRFWINGERFEVPLTEIL